VVASLIFYASLQVQYLLLMVALMLVTFFIGNAITGPDGLAHSQPALATGGKGLEPPCPAAVVGHCH
jgi:hypothetical protein